MFVADGEEEIDEVGAGFDGGRLVELLLLFVVGLGLLFTLAGGGVGRIHGRGDLGVRRRGCESGEDGERGDYI